jgi:hypothetical protein
MALLLTRLPSLTKLFGSEVVLPDPGVLLSRLPRLVDLRMGCHASVNVDLCVAALARCPQLTKLTFRHDLLTDAHLCTLLPQLPRLASLHLVGYPALTSLCFLSATAHLQHTLKELDLRDFAACSPLELIHLRGLTSLQTLSFIRCFSSPLDVLTRASLTPGSPHFMAMWWPRLADFKYHQQ